MKVLYGAEIELGHSLFDYMTVLEDRETARRNLDRALAGELLVEEAYSGGELRSRQYFRVSHSPIRTEEGKVIDVVVLAQDLTDRRHAEEEVRNLARRYRDELDEKGRHYLDTILDCSVRMGTLIEELLEYARLGRITVRVEPVPLEPLVAGLRATFEARIQAAGGSLEVIEPLAVPLADAALLERILANLVDNAITYCRPEVAPRVTLSAVHHHATVTLVVADNGIGIPPEFREKIFEVFARLHAEGEYRGTGIGLSIVRKAARLMGSDVTLESVEGQGSTFRLELPAAKGHRGAAYGRSQP